MRPRMLRLWLLLAALVFGQTAMLAHAAEHVGDAVAVADSCLVCLAGHDLGGHVPPSMPPDLPDEASASILPPSPPAGCPVAAVAHRFARGPPTA